MSESYEKLVRSKIPEFLSERGIPHEVREISEEEYAEELIKKTLEEAREFSQEGSVEELADLIEVVEALKSLDQFKDVEEIRLRKKEEKGGFERHIIVKGEK